MIESRHADFTTPYVQSDAPLLAASLPAVFFVTLGLVWYKTNAWLAGFVFLFTLFVAIGSWWKSASCAASPRPRCAAVPRKKSC